jgi:GAF domain-containing protein
MQSAPLPANESDRLDALKRYEVLDTPDEVDFDDFTWLASQICGTPIALISLIDATRQWFKSRVGLEARETPRERAFCGHTILGTKILEVPDALQDVRFHDNPLVTGAPDIRFYAGTPLTTHDGFNLGSLCVIDRAPRHLSDLQRESLVRLGRQVVMQLELRLARRQLQLKLDEINTLSNLLPMCAWCRKVRDDKGYWDDVTAFFTKRENIRWTHGVCPDCLKSFLEGQAKNTPSQTDLTPPKQT